MVYENLALYTHTYLSWNTDDDDAMTESDHGSCLPKTSACITTHAMQGEWNESQSFLGIFRCMLFSCYIHIYEMCYGTENTKSQTKNRI